MRNNPDLLIDNASYPRTVVFKGTRARQMLAFMLSAKGDMPREPTQIYWTRVMLEAARDGKLEELELCLEHNPHIDFPEQEEGCSALILAAYEGHLECVRALLDAGANDDVQDFDNMTALGYADDAAEDGDENYVQILKLLESHMMKKAGLE